MQRDDDQQGTAPDRPADHVADPSLDDGRSADWTAEGGAMPTGPATAPEAGSPTRRSRPPQDRSSREDAVAARADQEADDDEHDARQHLAPEEGDDAGDHQDRGDDEK